MPSTSDTEFYSLSLNSLAPPPYSLARPTSIGESNLIGIDEKQRGTFAKVLVRRFTPPFFRTNTELINQDKSSLSRFARFRKAIIDLVIDWWLWEIISWCMCALCTLAIALLLGYYNGKAVPDRWPLGITLNAYIAILSGIAKFTLAVPVDSLIGQLKWHWMAQRPRPLLDFERFDDASRGPWGALMLLICTRGRTIASIGAIVTILSLAIDPFFQQLIDLPKRPDLLSQSAVPRMVNFTLQRNTYSTATKPTEIGPDRLLQEMAFSYMVNNGTTRDISAFCPNEECSWKPFDTIGICSECSGTTSLLTRACLEESGDWRQNMTVDSANATKVFSCGYFMNATSDDPILMSGYALNTSSTPAQPLEFLLMRNLNLRDINVDRTYWNGSIDHAFPGFPLVDFLQVASVDTASILRGDEPVARECALRWCTKRIAASYDEGEYHEQVISEAFDTGPPYDALDIDEIMFFNYSKDISITPPQSEQTFHVPSDTTLSAIFVLQEFFPAYLSTPNTTATPLLRTRNFAGEPPRFWPYEHNPFASFKLGNEYIAKMTQAMTNVIRAYPGSSEMFKGSGGLETFIRVRWGFFALPAMLVTLTLILLIAVIWDHKKHADIGIMKSSVLAAMVNGVGRDADAAFPTTNSLSTIFKYASESEGHFRREQHRCYIELKR